MTVKDILNLCGPSTPVRIYYLDGACNPNYLFYGDSSDVPVFLKYKIVHGLCPVSSGFSSLGTLAIDLTDYDLLNGVVRNEID